MRTDGSGAGPDGGADAVTSVEGGGQEAGGPEASVPDGSADSGLPDASCPPLQASGYTITDTTTHLSWSRFAYPPATYTDATSTCTSWGGRLPSESELVAFASTAYGAIGVCTDPLSLPWPASGDPMWTTTMDSSNSRFFITVYYTGLTTSHPETDGVGYICVKP
jgi:hypothetical protein